METHGNNGYEGKTWNRSYPTYEEWKLEAEACKKFGKLGWFLSYL